MSEETKEETNELPKDIQHRSGFVNIIGNPNVGKSTLMNALVGEKMSIITPKPQTTRHRIIGLISGEDFQIVLSDTPGTIQDPNYKMQNAMNHFAYSVFEDADVVLFVTELDELYDGTERVFDKLRNTKVPKILVINKIDKAKSQDKLNALIKEWTKEIEFDEVFLISALEGTGVKDLMKKIKSLLPEGPAYYPKDQLSDKPQRFFISEIVREKILHLYHQEIPYASEVIIDRYEETTLNGEAFTKIYADIYVMRRSQKQIVIGKKGESIKKLGIEARKSIEAYLGNRIYLELYVKIKEKWRDSDQMLKSFGYINK